MAQTFTAPDGHVYTWDKETPPTQGDLDALVQQDAKRTTLQQQWNQSGPVERIKMMANYSGEALKDIGIEAGLATAGQAVGAAMGGKIGSQIGAGIGDMAGNAIVQGRNITAGRQESFRPGEMIGSGLATALTPGGTLAKAPAQAVLKQGAIGAAANLAGKTYATALDEGELPTLGEAGQAAGMGALAAPLAKLGATGKKAAKEAEMLAQDSVRNRNLKIASDFGYVLDPALANPSFANKTMTKIAGQTQLQREAIFKNQKVTDLIARTEIGLPPDAELSRPALMKRKFELGEPYREVAKINQGAADDLKQLQAERVASRDNWRRYAKDGDPKYREDAVQADKEAARLETNLETTALKNGKAGLVDELREARKLLAKTHVIEAALNPADGHVSATVIGAMYDKGKKLSDGLEVIANMENVMPQVMKEAAVTQAVGSQSFRPFIASALGAYGYQMAGVPGAIGAAGAAAFGDVPARGLMLSKPYQSLMTTPRYNTTQPNLAESFLRYGSQTAGRK